MTVEDIERAKQWAWGVTYYTVLAQGGILAVYAAYVEPPPGLVIRAAFLGLLIAVTVVSHISITHSFESLKAFRARANRCREFFEPVSTKILGDTGAERTWPLRVFVWATGVLISILLLLHTSVAAGGK
jgi:hypothetical protein